MHKIDICLIPFFSQAAPHQYSCLENPMDGGVWKAAVHGVAKSWTRLSDFTFTFYFHALKKEMATHSSVLAWRIPGTGEPGGLLSMGSHRVGHDWSDLAAAAAYTYISIVPLPQSIQWTYSSSPKVSPRPFVTPASSQLLYSQASTGLLCYYQLLCIFLSSV